MTMTTDAHPDRPHRTYPLGALALSIALAVGIGAAAAGLLRPDARAVAVITTDRPVADGAPPRPSPDESTLPSTTPSAVEPSPDTREPEPDESGAPAAGTAPAPGATPRRDAGSGSRPADKGDEEADEDERRDRRETVHGDVREDDIDEDDDGKRDQDEDHDRKREDDKDSTHDRDETSSEDDVGTSPAVSGKDSSSTLREE